MHLTKQWLVAAALLGISGGVAAQTYPNRPIRFIVPYVAGGAGDIFARVVGQKLGDAFHQQVVIDNRPGANGIIGTDMLAKSPPEHAAPGRMTADRVPTSETTFT